MHCPKVMLIIMDGWGFSPIEKGNAILQAKTPNYDMFWNNYPHTLLNAFGENVGLPWGSIGSSEVGHMSIGSGRLVSQELTLIDKEIERGEFFTNPKVLDFVKTVNQNKRPIHLIGLISDGGVHSHMRHLYALLKALKRGHVKNSIFIHVITDGRDTAPKSGLQYVTEMEAAIKKIGLDVSIATISGRFYAMDRDSRWERTEAAYKAMVFGAGERFDSFKKAFESNYEKNITDEFVLPAIINQKISGSLFSKINNSVDGKIIEGDNVFFFNIRPDRMRQIVEIFLFKKETVDVSPIPKSVFYNMTTYDELLPVHVLFPSPKIIDPVAKLLGDNGIAQGHFAETEKYAHVTYFFNGGNPTPNKLESWNLVPSPKVKTYDLEPEMSADKITDKIFNVVDKEKLDFVLVNYANSDMVAHTGVFDKVVLAVETVDKQLGRLWERYGDNTNYIITADHGNAECMLHPETGEIDKKHTVNPVPFILVERSKKASNQQDEIPLTTGILADIAPTLLSYFNIKPSENMNGINLRESLKK